MLPNWSKKREGTSLHLFLSSRSRGQQPAVPLSSRMVLGHTQPGVAPCGVRHAQGLCALQHPLRAKLTHGLALGGAITSLRFWHLGLGMGSARWASVLVY